MTFTIKLWLHSSEKDHTIMTWGTLKIDKEVTFQDNATVYIYTVQLFSSNDFDTDVFHKWIHVIEHLLAYSKDTWSVRSSISELLEDFDEKWILDVSPCAISDWVYGFKITSLVPILTEQLYQALTLSLKNATLYLESSHESSSGYISYQNIPFATPGQCWQYNYHCRDTAVKLLKNHILNSQSQITEKIISDDTQKILVCDLRLLKPKLEGRDDMIMFSPNISYMISHAIEKKLPEIIETDIVVVWTFWCMTGMYLCVSAHQWDQSEVNNILANIMNIILEIDMSNFSENEKIQIKEVLLYYSENPKIFGNMSKHFVHNSSNESIWL